MSPRRDPRKLLVLALALGALVCSSCIFSPKQSGGGPPPVTIPVNQDQLIQALKTAYHAQDYPAYVNLFPAPEDNAPFGFFLDPASLQPGDPTNWDLTEELRIQRRMFKPGDPLPGETPVPTELWLVSIDISLTRTSPSWVERTDLYRSDTNPNGLDSAKWKVTDAQYHAEVFFKTQGSTDYRVDGKANFIVVEDLTKASGTDRKFLIYRWEDLGTFSKPAPEPI